jgi:hypothetical protein
MTYFYYYWLQQEIEKEIRSRHKNDTEFEPYFSPFYVMNIIFFITLYEKFSMFDNFN